MQPHDLGFGGEPGDRLDDRVGIAQILTQIERVHGDRCRAVPVEDPLMFVSEGVENAGRRCAQARLDSLPPDVREILALVDDDRIEQVGRITFTGEFAQPLRQRDLPVVRVVIGTRLRAPLQRQVMEQAHICRALRRRPLGDRELHEPGQATRIAHHCHT